jgi:tRNA A-37 threonylcarbamoyl transferase component Bud32
MAATNEEEELKEVFKACGENGDGHLDFDHFYALLKSGNEGFKETEAYELFRAADRDLSGDIDFGEFVDFLYNNKDFGSADLRASVAAYHDIELEARAKQQVLARSVTLRNEASRAVRAAGEDWKQLKWEQRLNVINNIEHGRPAMEDLDRPSQLRVPVEEDDAQYEMKAVKSMKRREQEAAAPSIPAEEKKAQEVSRKPAAKKTKSPLEGKTLAEMVDYSLHRYDLCFADNDAGNNELLRFKESLKDAKGPPPDLEFEKYLAKGTQGWVFLGRWKSGNQAAVKAIRMTQAVSGVKEWYISKLCRKANIEKIVFTAPTVYVIVRSEAQPVIEERLRDAGPVEHYVCLVQDFMNGGTLEQLIESEDVTPQKMFTALEDVAQTLAQMHANKITHRDIKPENVLLEVDGGSIKAKLCDLGSAELGDKGLAAGRTDDIRRFGVMMFSLATGEGWTKQRLLHEKHENLIARLTEAVEQAEDEVMKRLPDIVQQILNGKHTMAEVADIMTDLRKSC